LPVTLELSVITAPVNFKSDEGQGDGRGSLVPVDDAKDIMDIGLSRKVMTKY